MSDIEAHYASPTKLKPNVIKQDDKLNLSGDTIKHICKTSRTPILL